MAPRIIPRGLCAYDNLISLSFLDYYLPTLILFRNILWYVNNQLYRNKLKQYKKQKRKKKKHKISNKVERPFV
jgi:hypothetical protein